MSGATPPVPSPPERPIAGTDAVPNTGVVRQRVLALVIDSLVLLPVTLPLLALLGPLATVLAVSVVQIAYWGIFDGVVGRTPGRVFMAIRVVDGNGRSPIGFGKAALRYVCWFLDGLLVVAPGFLLVLLTSDHRRIGDMAAGTVVVDTTGERETPHEQTIRRVLPKVATVAAIVGAILMPFAVEPTGGFIEDATLAAAYTVMALGLNIVVGFAGLLDLGYVAFFALGAYTIGWFASSFFSGIGGEQGVRIWVEENVGPDPSGLHLNFLLIVVLAAAICALAGVVIGLPTLRLRGDYIAIVTLAFGEIIYRFALNGDSLVVDDYKLTNGRQGITPVDNIDLPLLDPFSSVENRRPFYWLALALALLVLFVNFRLRDSRLGRAWIAVREDEVAAASMGVPLVKTKLMAYAVGAAFGGMSGAFLGALLNTVNADSFLFSFSIFVLAMIILGGLGSIWGVVFGAVALSFINYWLIPDVINDVPSKVGLDFDLTQLNFGIFGFLLVLVMVLRPQGLFPERRRKLELAEGVGTGEEALYEARS